MKCRLLVILVLIPLVARPASAGIIFGRKNKKTNPDQRVPELVSIVKTDGDEDKRAAAAHELRQYDSARYPYIVPILIDVLLTDKKPGVRAEAAQSLGKIRPVSQQVGQALERTLAADPSMRVRLQARSALLQYHWNGYRSVKKDNGALIPQSKEPPLADPLSRPPAMRLVPAPTPTQTGRLAPQPAPLPIPAVAPGLTVTPASRSSPGEPPPAPVKPAASGPELTPPD